MSNYKKLVAAFVTSLGITEDFVKDDLRYNSIPEWDSIAHMTLVAELETVFDVMLVFTQPLHPNETPSGLRSRT